MRQPRRQRPGRHFAVSSEINAHFVVMSLLHMELETAREERVSELSGETTKSNATETEELIDPQGYPSPKNRPPHIGNEISGRRDSVLAKQLIELNARRTTEAQE